MNNSTKIDILHFFLFLSIIFSYIIYEDTLGGAKADFILYEKIIYLFSNDLFSALKNYASYEFTRNSPFFFILLSFFHKMGLDIDTIRYLNILSVFLLTYFFFDCLKIKFGKTNVAILKIFSLVLFLSPTIRSLVVWPYPILYAFLFFLIATKYYLLFCRDKKNKLKNALLNILFVAVASYLTPNFSVFAIFFTYRFFLEFNLNKNFFYVIIFNLILAIPAVIFYYNTSFYILDISVASSVDITTRLNPFNKIIIITNILLFYFIPFLGKEIFKKLISELKSFNKNYLTLIFIFISIIFFDFPHGFGGGIIYHLSNKLFSNSVILFLFFFISIYIFRAVKITNLNNILIFICLITYNLQASIYHKYFDPLLLFIFLFLLTFKNSSLKLNLDNMTKKYYYLYIFFLAASFYKVNFLI